MYAYKTSTVVYMRVIKAFEIIVKCLRVKTVFSTIVV